MPGSRISSGSAWAWTRRWRGCCRRSSWSAAGVISSSAPNGTVTSSPTNPRWTWRRRRAATMSRRQIAMVMDLNKCIGCQTCTTACKTQWTNRDGREYMYWNNVETHPGNGYPSRWEESGGGFDDAGNLKPGRIPDLHRDYGAPFELNYDEALGCVTVDKHSSSSDNERPELKPVVPPVNGPNWDEDQGAGEYPNNYYFYLPRICNHCTNPACLAACPRQAIYKREEDGIVLIDQERCRGYQHCVGRIRFIGYLDDVDGPVHKLVEKWKVALPLHAEYGTQPNVYYVPPLSPPKYDAQGRMTGERRIPDAFLTGLLGPRVPEVLKLLEQEREKKRRGKESELMDLLIAYRHEEMFKLDADYYRKPGAPQPPAAAGL